MKTKIASADIKIYQKNSGIVFNQKSLIAFDSKTERVLTFGNEAETAEAFDPDRISTVCFLKLGHIVDYTVAEQYFKWIMISITKRSFRKPNISMCIPADSNEIDKRAFSNLLYEIGSKDSRIYMQPFDEIVRILQNPDCIEAPDFKKSIMKTDYFIGICKDDKSEYINERLCDAVTYAKECGASMDDIRSLVDAVK